MIVYSDIPLVDNVEDIVFNNGWLTIYSDGPFSFGNRERFISQGNDDYLIKENYPYEINYLTIKCWCMKIHEFHTREDIPMGGIWCDNCGRNMVYYTNR